MYWAITLYCMKIEHGLPTLPTRFRAHCLKMPTALEDFRNERYSFVSMQRCCFQWRKPSGLLGMLDFRILVGETESAGQAGSAI